MLMPKRTLLFRNLVNEKTTVADVKTINAATNHTKGICKYHSNTIPSITAGSMRSMGASAQMGIK